MSKYKAVAKKNVRLAIRNGESERPTVTALFSVIPANNHDLSDTTEHESAATKSGATDASRPAGFIRACRLLLDGLPISLRQGKAVPRPSRQSRPSTDEPSAHPWRQISNSCCTKGRHFQVIAGIQHRQGRGAYDLVAAGVPGPHFLAPDQKPAPDLDPRAGLTRETRALIV
jgi:hypothetical protein